MPAFALSLAIGVRNNTCLHLYPSGSGLALVCEALTFWVVQQGADSGRLQTCSAEVITTPRCKAALQSAGWFTCSLGDAVRIHRLYLQKCCCILFGSVEAQKLSFKPEAFGLCI